MTPSVAMPVMNSLPAAVFSGRKPLLRQQPVDHVTFGANTENENASLELVIRTYEDALNNGKIGDIQLLDKNQAKLTIDGKPYLFKRGGYYTLSRRYETTRTYTTRWRKKQKTDPAVGEVALTSQRLNRAGRPASLQYYDVLLKDGDDMRGWYYPNPQHRPDYLNPQFRSWLMLHSSGTWLASDENDDVALAAEAFCQRLEAQVFTKERLEAVSPLVHLQT